MPLRHRILFCYILGIVSVILYLGFIIQHKDSVYLRSWIAPKRDNLNDESVKQIDRKVMPRSVMDTICDIDRKRLAGLLGENPVLSNRDTMFDHFQTRMISPCVNMMTFGGQYSVRCKFRDGSKHVCMDQLVKDVETGSCLIYSFGIDGDWTFETEMVHLGCQVNGFDPTVDYASEFLGFNFEMIGITPENGTNDKRYKTLKEILEKNGHANHKISMLKMDIEGNGEIDVVANAMDDGSLSNIHQLAMEVHLTKPFVDDDDKALEQFFKVFQRMNKEQNLRLIHSEPNRCYIQKKYSIENKKKISKDFDIFEIVMVKVNDEYPDSLEISDLCGIL